MLQHVDLALLSQDPGVTRLVVGLSGGLDSVVLLDLLAKHATLPVTGLHINHHLQPDADEAAAFCLALGQQYGLPVEVIDVTVKATGSLETNARRARYQAFETFLAATDLLVLAHHEDDQLETALFKLFRGSRVPGIQGMPRARALGESRLVRPLLDCSRREITAYAQAQRLRWVEDPTNSDTTTADRNYIRHALLPLIEARFPGARDAVKAGMTRDERFRDALQNQWQDQLSHCQCGTDALSLPKLKTYASEQIQNLLTQWLLALDAPLPSGRFLLAVINDIKKGGRVDRHSGGICYHVLHDRLYVTRALPPTTSTPASQPLEDAVQAGWRGGEFSVESTTGPGGLRTADYRVTSRQGGEKIRRGRNRSLKNLFQEVGVPPWLRDRVPLLTIDNEVVGTGALPDWGVPMLIADDWQAAADAPGLLVSLSLGDRLGVRG